MAVALVVASRVAGLRPPSAPTPLHKCSPPSSRVLSGGCGWPRPHSRSMCARPSREMAVWPAAYGSGCLPGAASRPAPLAARRCQPTQQARCNTTTDIVRRTPKRRARPPPHCPTPLWRLHGEFLPQHARVRSAPVRPAITQPVMRPHNVMRRGKLGRTTVRLAVAAAYARRRGCGEHRVLCGVGQCCNGVAHICRAAPMRRGGCGRSGRRLHSVLWSHC